jgi:hypothetical protein
MISLCSWDTYAIEMSEKKKDINRAVRQVFKGIKCQQLADDLSTPEERRLPSNPLGNWEHDLKTQTQRWNDKQTERIQDLSCGMLLSPGQTWNVTGVAIC